MAIKLVVSMCGLELERNVCQVGWVSKMSNVSLQVMIFLHDSEKSSRKQVVRTLFKICCRQLGCNAALLWTKSSSNLSTLIYPRQSTIVCRYSGDVEDVECGAFCRGMACKDNTC